MRPVFEGMQRGRPGLVMALVRYLVLTVPLAWAGSRAAAALDLPQLYGMLLGLMGVMGTAGQLLLTRGYAVAAAGQVSPFTYFSVVFGAIYGYLFWNETLDWLFVAGALLIAGSGVMAVRGLGRKQDSTVMQADAEATRA